MRPARAAGFSLIELVAVIVVVSIGMVGLAKMFSNTNLKLARATDEQAAAQYVQECAERVLQTKRDYGLTSTRLVSTMCDTPTLSGYTRTVSLPSSYTGTTSGACPSTIVCRDATITVCAGSVSPCPTGATRASATFTMVSY